MDTQNTSTTNITSKRHPPLGQFLLQTPQAKKTNVELEVTVQLYGYTTVPSS